MIAAIGFPPDTAQIVANIVITYFFGWTRLLMDMSKVPSWLHWAANMNIFSKDVEMMFSIIVEDMDFDCGPLSDLSQAQLGCDDGIVSGEEARQRLGISSS